MKVIAGDIWTLPLKWWLVIPTNNGWTKNKPVRNIMGRGLAAQAAERYPTLAEDYGLELHKRHLHQQKLGVIYYSVKDPNKHNLLLSPTKPLNPEMPWLSWKNKATLEQVEITLIELSEKSMHVALPLLGCGNGGLSKDEVVRLMEKYLTGPNFLLVEQSPQNLERIRL